MTDKRQARQPPISNADFVRLAAFRHALRRFLRFSESAAARVGVTGQQYQALLSIRGGSPDGRMSINDLAAHLLIKHNSAVGLVDRLVQDDLVVREASSADRRKVQLRVTGRGHQVLSRLATVHRAELQRVGPLMERFFSELSHPAAAGRRRRA